jgi:hypothetical protein
MSLYRPKCGLQGIADIDRNLSIVAQLIESDDGLVQHITKLDWN